ncbi:MAG: DUF2905 domain-containing protein [Bdellovibrionota bacterium]
MNPTSKFLIMLGFLVVAVGVAWHFFAGRGIPLGRLPGDFTFERENFKIYLPLTTSALLSILVSTLVWIYNRFR